MKAPQISVQESISEELEDVRNGKVTGTFWVNLDGNYQEFVRLSGEEGFGSADGHRATLEQNRVEVTKNGDSVASIILGNKTQSLKRFPKLSCGDCFGDRALLGTQSGGLNLVQINAETDDGVQLPGHYVYTSVAKFFPSGKVAISAGMDYSMKLWDLQEERLAANGPEVQTLRYQRGLVDDIVMIGRGRNLLSLCKADAERAVALWEVGTPSVVCDYPIKNANCIALWESADSSIVNSDLYDGNGKLALAGAADQIALIDFREETPTSLVPEGADLMVVDGVNLYRSADRSIKLTDLRYPGKLVGEIREAGASQMVKGGGMICFRNALGTYGFSASSFAESSQQPVNDEAVNVFSCETYGVLVGGANNVWNLGTELRLFST